MSKTNNLFSQVETARMWGYFHKDWLLQIRQELRRQLPGEYRVFVESEAVLISPDSSETVATVLPDVAVVPRTAPFHSESGTMAEHCTSATIDAEEPCELDTHYSLIIRRAPDQRVVAAVELLSPSNKGVGNRLDEEAHLRKRDHYLHAGVSLLEIDALLKGRRVLPDPIAPIAIYDRIAWTVQSDAGRRRYRGWGWNQNEALPQLDWQIDAHSRVVINLERTVDEAIAFNNWDQLLTSP